MVIGSLSHSHYSEYMFQRKGRKNIIIVQHQKVISKVESASVVGCSVVLINYN